MAETASELMTQRYVELVQTMKEELGGTHGWKAEVARRLGVSPSYIAKIDRGEAGEIGLSAIKRATEALGLPRRWFVTQSDKYPVQAYREARTEKPESMDFTPNLFVMEDDRRERDAIAKRREELLEQAKQILLGDIEPDVDGDAPFLEFAREVLAFVPFAELQSAVAARELGRDEKRAIRRVARWFVIAAGEIAAGQDRIKTH